MPLLYLRDCSLGGVPPRADTEPALEDFRAGSVSLRHTFIHCNAHPYVRVGVKLRMPDIPPEPQPTPAASGVSCRGAVPPPSTGTPDIQGPLDATATVSATAPSVVQPAAGSGNGVPVVPTIDPSPAPSQPGRTTPAPASMSGAASANLDALPVQVLLRCPVLRLAVPRSTSN